MKVVNDGGLTVYFGASEAANPGQNVVSLSRKSAQELVDRLTDSLNQPTWPEPEGNSAVVGVVWSWRGSDRYAKTYDGEWISLSCGTTTSWQGIVGGHGPVDVELLYGGTE